MGLLAAILAGGCASTGEKREPTSAAQSAASAPQPQFVDDTAYEAAQRALEAGRFTEAEHLLLSLTEKYPQLAGPWANLGLAYNAQDKLADAERALATAVEINPRMVEAQNVLASVYRRQGEIEKAAQMYKQAIAQDPTYANTHYNLALLLDVYLQDYAGAVEHYERYLELNGDSDRNVELWMAQAQRAMSRGN